MANTTIKGALAIHGQNPQVYIYFILGVSLFLICAVPSGNCNSESNMGVDVLEGTLFRIDRCVFTVTTFFGVLLLKTRSAESLIDKAIDLHCIGGVYGNQRPTEFLCLLLKLLQLQPEKEILVEYLQADEFK
ncbi:PRP38 family-domain-containing protein [Butyriboletus roseoflavus]|nr:PRP38 family-domain-containing protein [Butyriboletus roseoflavus]